MKINKITSTELSTPLRNVPSEDEEKKLHLLHCASCSYLQKDARPGAYCGLFKRRIEPKTNRCLNHTMDFSA